jgi:hypothetical protein
MIYFLLCREIELEFLCEEHEIELEFLCEEHLQV